MSSLISPQRNKINRKLENFMNTAYTLVSRKGQIYMVNAAIIKKQTSEIKNSKLKKFKIIIKSCPCCLN